MIQRLPQAVFFFFPHTVNQEMIVPTIEAEIGLSHAYRSGGLGILITTQV